MSYFELPSLVVYYLNVSFSRLHLSRGKESCFSAIDYSYFCFFFLFEVVHVLSRRCLGKAVSFYCSTPWALNITSLEVTLLYRI